MQSGCSSFRMRFLDWCIEAYNLDAALKCSSRCASGFWDRSFLTQTDDRPLVGVDRRRPVRNKNWTSICTICTSIRRVNSTYRFERNHFKVSIRLINSTFQFNVSTRIWEELQIDTYRSDYDISCKPINAWQPGDLAALRLWFSLIEKIHFLANHSTTWWSAKLLFSMYMIQLRIAASCW